MTDVDTARAQRNLADRLDSARRAGRDIIEWPDSGAGEERKSFDLKLVGNKAYIFDGDLILHDVSPGKFSITGFWWITGTPLELSGSTEWIVIRHAKNHSATELLHVAGTDRPVTSGNYWYFGLWRCTSTDGGLTYDKVWIGDEPQLGAPL